MILLSLPLIVNFVGRVQAETKMSAEVQRRSEQLQQEQTTLTQLRAALDYAKSDAFTERYAREQDRYAKPGEVVVVPPSAQDSTTPRALWWEDFVARPTVAATPGANATAQPVDRNR